MTAQRLARELAGVSRGSRAANRARSCGRLARKSCSRGCTSTGGHDPTERSTGYARRGRASERRYRLHQSAETVAGNRLRELPWGRPPGARRCDGTRAQANESSTPSGATELRMTSIACCHAGVASPSLRPGLPEVKPFADRDSFVIFLPLGIGRPPEEFRHRAVSLPAPPVTSS